uniref:Uncharacterized protein n=1 Tax=Tanacetum cinerariifolium TaxID=118510 RepID=A0A6L2J9S2_TANCI|nr:hypothetical protein [Tanacetum cinerariifolium]
MGGAMAQVRPEGSHIQSSDPPLSTGSIVGSREDMMEHAIELTDLVPQTPYDSPLSGGHTPRSDEGSMTLKELTDLYTTLSQKVLDLEKVKTAQVKEIASLKRRVTKLEQRQISRLLGFHPFRAGTSRRHRLGRRNVSKQGRKNLKSHQKDKGSGEKGGSTVEIVSTARPDISSARPEVSTAAPKTPPTTTTFFDDEDVIIDDTLVKIKSQKAKEKGVAFKDADDSARPIRSITTLQPLPTIDLKNKVKCILQEPEPVKKTKKRDQDQIKRDAEVALKIQADLDEEIDVDHELAARLTHEEQEKYTVEERSKLLAEFFERRKKQLAKERVEAIRSNPPTKTKLRNLMMTYLKHTGRMLEVLDRQDVLDLRKIVMERFPANDPEGYDLILWGDLKTLMESSEDDEIWRNQQDWKLKKSKVFGYILMVIMKLILKKLDFHQVKIKFRG